MLLPLTFVESPFSSRPFANRFYLNFLQNPVGRHYWRPLQARNLRLWGARGCPGLMQPVQFCKGRSTVRVKVTGKGPSCRIGGGHLRSSAPCLHVSAGRRNQPSNREDSHLGRALWRRKSICSRSELSQMRMGSRSKGHLGGGRLLPTWDRVLHASLKTPCRTFMTFFFL